MSAAAHHAGGRPGAAATGRRSPIVGWQLPAVHWAGSDTIDRLAADLALAESRAVDFVVVGDRDGTEPADDHTAPGVALLATTVAAAIAAEHTSIGIVAELGVADEPFHTSRAIATVDFLSDGRGAVQLDLQSIARRSTRHREPDGGWPELADFVAATVALWDSWDDEAIVRDADSAHYIATGSVRAVHHAGPFFSVRGPSVTPRPPQGHPPVLLRVDDTTDLDAVGFVPDVLVVDAPRLDVAAAVARRWQRRSKVLVRLGAGAARGGRLTLRDVPEAGDLQAAGLDGVVLTEAPTPVVLQRLGVAAEVPPAGTTLRQRLGLAPAVNRFAPTAGGG